MILGPIEFRSPLWLLLAPLLWVVAWWLARGSLAGLGPVTRRFAIGLRAMVILLLAVALAEPVWRDTSDDVAVSVIVDASRSVPLDARIEANAVLQRASEDARATDRVGIVSAAREALVQALPSERVRTIEVGDAGDLDATNLAAGVRLAMASSPEDAALRLVLISDGNETTGSLLAAAQSAAAAGVPIDVYVVGYSHDSEVILEDLITPPTARRGETVNVRFVLTATAPTIGRLNLTLNDQPIDLDPEATGLGATIELAEGANTVTIPVMLTSTGPQRFEAFFEPVVASDDAIPQNNRQDAVTFVAEQGRVLIYVGQGADLAAEPIIRALDRADITAESRPASQGHDSLIELGAYDAIVLVDTPAWEFTQKQQDELRSYVHDLGGGLVMIGGPQSYGAGGWIGSPLADAMPVKMDPPQKRVMPRGALALIMHSCEMPDGNAAGREVARAAVGALSRLDLVGVLEYSWQAGGAGWIFPMAEVGDGFEVNRAIDNLSFGDMPDFNSAMNAALTGLNGVSAGQKHCIVISDGDPSGPGQALVRRFVDAGITISTVAVFPHGGSMNSPDMRKMQGIAQMTGGQFYAVPFQYSVKQLPQIFIKEAQTVKRSLVWEGDPFTPKIVNVAAEGMRGIHGVPPIAGYVITADREGLSLVSLRSEQDDPILAQWQYGLGRTVAFTSDSATRWAPSWPAWDGSQSFWAQHLRWAMRPSGSGNLTVYTERDGDDTVLVVEALNASGERMNFAQFLGRVVKPNLESEQVTMRQTGPGRYEGRFRADDAGSYLVNMRYDAPDADGAGIVRGSAQIAVSRSFAEEHRFLRDNLPLLRQVAQTTGGRILSDEQVIDGPTLFAREGLSMPVRSAPIWLPVAIAALSVFLIDAGVRRVRIDVRAMAAFVRRGFSKRDRASEEQIGAMRAARERTQKKLAGRGAGQATMGGMSQQRDTSSIKFEADEAKTPPTKPLGLEAPIERKTKKEPTADEGEEGMSRLLKAKRRARDEMDDQDRKDDER